VVRALVFTAAPILVAMGLHDSLTPKYEVPVENRTVNPAPPASISVNGQTFALQDKHNPFRVNVVGEYSYRVSDEGEYSYTVHEQNHGADPWASDAIPYMRHVREGGVIYFQYCHFCHGGALDARGIFSNAIRPWPPNFSDPATIAQIQESYVFWRTYSGGQGMPREGFPWASTMPAYGDDLSPQEIWRVILFMYWFTGLAPRTWD
jgi:hypothetical protein